MGFFFVDMAYLIKPYKDYFEGGEIVEGIASIIANLGFPIGVSIFLLVRVESRMEKLTDCINTLSNNISAMNTSSKGERESV
jgi:hypothetical protein